MDSTSAPDDRVDLNFTTMPARGQLPDAVDADGLPVDRAAPAPLPGPGAGRETGLGPEDAGVVGAGDPIPAAVAATLPTGDWTKVGANGADWLSPGRHSNLTRAVLVGLVLLLFVPLVVVLVTMLNNLGNAAGGTP